MKVVFIGGGALRHLAVIRGALAKGIFGSGEIILHDLNVPRAEAMGRMIMKTPEYARVRCKVAWGTTLDQALDGADAVSVVLMAGSPRSFALGNLARSAGRRQEADKHFTNVLHLLDRYQQDDLLPESEGMTAGRLAEIINSLPAEVPAA